MRIGIDISQIVYEGTGVGTYVRKLVSELLAQDKRNDYVLFGASLRQGDKFRSYYRSLDCDPKKVTLQTVAIPPTLLDFLWNTLHIAPIEWFVGPIDVFWSSDWTQPPLAHARGVTTVHDLSILKYPESFNRKILSVQRRRLKRTKQECDAFLCDSKATQKDLVDLLKIDVTKTKVVYPGFS
jgi:glycosyltransferase involved in cell wall biosynthesis